MSKTGSGQAFFETQDYAICLAGYWIVVVMRSNALEHLNTNYSLARWWCVKLHNLYRRASSAGTHTSKASS